MADINIERKSSNAWLWWLLGLIVLAMLAWWLLSGDDEAEVAEVEPAPAVAPADPVAGSAPPPQPAAQGGPLTLADVWTDPGASFGSRVHTPEAVRVAEVISDRGFWVESQGQRMLVVINESAPGAADQADVQGKQAEMPDVNAGDMVHIAEAVAHDPANLQNVQGTVEPDVREALNGQRVFLVTDGRNLHKQ